MSYVAGRFDVTDLEEEEVERKPRRPAPGKRTRTLALAGRPLPEVIRAQFEASLGRDLGAVRVHDGDESAAAARAAGAQAFAIGNDIHFAEGAYRPDDAFGLHLLAHEVAHTQQQRGGVVAQQHRMEVSESGDALEVEADRAADAMVAGVAFRSLSSTSAGGVVHRKPDGEKPQAQPQPQPQPQPQAQPQPQTQPQAQAPKKQAPAPLPKVPPKAPPASTPHQPPPAVAPATPPMPMPKGGEPVASKKDWKTEFGEFLLGNGGNAIRTGCEYGRLAPGLGLLTGMVADGIETYQGWHAFDKAGGADSPENERMAKLVMLRQGIAAANNVIGHLRYVGTMAQDGFLGSVIGSWLAGFTGPVLEALAGVSIAANTAVLGLDMGLAVSAQMKMSQHKEGTDAYNAYLGIRNNFIVNCGTDVISLVLDGVDLASLSAGNASVVKEAAPAVKGAMGVMNKLAPSLAGVVKGWYGVWGTTVWSAISPAPSAPAAAETPAPKAASNIAGAAHGDQVGPQGVLRSVAAQVMLAELSQMEAGYQLAATFIEYLMGTPQRMADDANKLIAAVSGKKDPMLWLRDRIAEGVKESTQQASKLLEMKDLAAKGEQVAHQLVSGAENVLAALGKIQLPQAKADGIGAAAANAVLGKIQTAINDVKGPAAKQIADMKAEGDWMVQFLGQFQKMANEQTAKLGEQGAKFSAALAKCKNLEDVMNMLLKFGTEALGAGPITVEDLKKGWKGIRATIDDGFKHARATAAGTPVAGQVAQPQPPVSGAAASP